MPIFSEEQRIVAGKSVFNNPGFRYVTYAIIALLLSIVNVLFVPLIAVGGVTPDLVLILGIMIALKEGQLVGLFAAFGCGLVFDAVSADVLGTNALAKILAVFVAGYFYSENQTQQIIGSYRFLLIVMLCAVIHNLVYYFFYVQPTDIDFFVFFMKFGLASSLYTTVIAIIPMLVIERKKRY